MGNVFHFPYLVRLDAIPPARVGYPWRATTGVCMINEVKSPFSRKRKKDPRWLSQRVYDSYPVLHALARQVKRLRKERRAPILTAQDAVRVVRFLPSFPLYAISVVIAAVFVCGLLFLRGSEADQLLNSSIPIQWTVTILALAVPVVSTYGGIRTSDELVISYLWHVTRIARFAELAGVAVVMNVVAWLCALGTAKASILGAVLLVSARSVALGLELLT